MHHTLREGLFNVVCEIDMRTAMSTHGGKGEEVDDEGNDELREEEHRAKREEVKDELHEFQDAEHEEVEEEEVEVEEEED